MMEMVVNGLCQGITTRSPGVSSEDELPPLAGCRMATIGSLGFVFTRKLASRNGGCPVLKGTKVTNILFCSVCGACSAGVF